MFLQHIVQRYSVAKIKSWLSSSNLQKYFCCPLILTDRQHNYKHVANLNEKYVIMAVEASLYVIVIFLTSQTVNKSVLPSVLPKNHDF